MQDTFWTPELLCEFFNSYPVSEPMMQMKMQQFKSSKSPKKEWEIVAYSFEPLKGIDKPVLVTQGSKYWERAISGDKDFLIHSVRRLSDSQTFSVGDKFKTFDREDIIEEFRMDGGRILVMAKYNKFYADAEFGMTMRKLPQPILTTVDGVEIRENEECWIVDKYYKLLPEPEKINEFKRNYYSNCFIFSTREAAEKHILDCAEKLSLNDVKEGLKAIPPLAGHSSLLEVLTALVKQKLNQ